MTTTISTNDCACPCSAHHTHGVSNRRPCPRSSNQTDIDSPRSPRSRQPPRLRPLRPVTLPTGAAAAGGRRAPGVPGRAASRQPPRGVRLVRRRGGRRRSGGARGAQGSCAVAVAPSSSGRPCPFLCCCCACSGRTGAGKRRGWPGADSRDGGKRARGIRWWRERCCRGQLALGASCSVCRAACGPCRCRYSCRSGGCRESWPGPRARSGRRRSG